MYRWIWQGILYVQKENIDSFYFLNYEIKTGISETRTGGYNDDITWNTRKVTI